MRVVLACSQLDQYDSRTHSTLLDMEKVLPALKYSRWSRVATLATGSLFLAADSSAIGFRQPNQDPEAIARGNAFVATADNPSAIYYYPARITQLEGQQVRVGIYAVSTGNDYTSPTGQTASP